MHLILQGVADVADGGRRRLLRGRVRGVVVGVRVVVLPVVADLRDERQLREFVLVALLVHLELLGRHLPPEALPRERLRQGRGHLRHRTRDPLVRAGVRSGAIQDSH